MNTQNQVMASIYSKTLIKMLVQTKTVPLNVDRLNKNRDDDGSNKWPSPPTDFVALNVDASVRECGSLAGCCGVVRNSSGVFLA